MNDDFIFCRSSEGSDKLFCSGAVPNLSDLYLANNQLQDINFNFECIKDLRFLDLSYNKIKRLDKTSLARIDNVFHQPHDNSDIPRKINLIGNPFVCDCYLRPVFDWLMNTTTNLYRKNDMRCYTGSPSSNAGNDFFLLIIKEDKFRDFDFFPYVFYRSQNCKCSRITMWQLTR